MELSRYATLTIYRHGHTGLEVLDVLVRYLGNLQQTDGTVVVDEGTTLDSRVELTDTQNTLQRQHTLISAFVLSVTSIMNSD